MNRKRPDDKNKLRAIHLHDPEFYIVDGNDLLSSLHPQWVRIFVHMSEIETQKALVSIQNALKEYKTGSIIIGFVGRIV